MKLAKADTLQSLRAVLCWNDNNEFENKVTSFADLGLNPDILKAIEDLGYTTPTPIQEQAIPYVLQMRDVLGCAQTGTGKTGGFTLPMIEILSQGRARARMPRSLILEPTRELATQVAENFKSFGKYTRQLNMALLIGGETMDAQIKELDRGVDVLIATPGRLIDLFERGRILLSDIKIFVIDEADRMLDMGFIPDIEKISKLLPAMRQTLFFSATMSPEMRKLADRFLSNPKTVTVAAPASTVDKISQIRVDMPSDNDWHKREALRTILRQENVQNAFIFSNRKSDVALLHRSLQKHGFNAGALHGDLDQSTRTETLDAFRAGTISLLVCSDVAARGLDIADVSHVFNYDVPFNAEDYVHRIGRTGRAGKSGVAYTLVTPQESKQIAAVEALIKQTIPRKVLEGLAEPNPDMNRGKRDHGKTRRVNKDHHGKPQHIKKQEAGDVHHVDVTAPPKTKRPVKVPEALIEQAVAQALPPAPKPTRTRRTPTKAVPQVPATQPAPIKEQHSESKGFGNDLPAFLRHSVAARRTTSK